MKTRKYIEASEVTEPSVASLAQEQKQAPRTLIYGTYGEDVQALQRILIERGEALQADGVFGIETFHAVVRWQYENHLPETGYLPPEDFALLKRG